MCPSLCPYHIVSITTALQCILKSETVIPLALFFFLKIALATQDLLWFCMNFGINCSSSVENTFGILVGTALNL